MRSLEWVWRNNIRGNIINYGSVKRRDTYNGLHWSHTTRTHNSKRGGRSHHVELQNLISSDQGFFTSFFSFLLINQPLVHYHVQVDSLQKVTFVQRVLLINDIHLNLCTLFCFFILYLTKARLFIEYLTEFCLINWKFWLQNPLSVYRNSNCRNWFVKRSDKMKGTIWK